MIYVVMLALFLASCRTQEELPVVHEQEQIIIEGEDERLPFIQETRLRMEEDYRASVDIQTTMIRSVHDHPQKERIQAFIDQLLDDLEFMEKLETTASTRNLLNEEIESYSQRKSDWTEESRAIAEILSQ